MRRKLKRIFCASLAALTLLASFPSYAVQTNNNGITGNGGGSGSGGSFTNTSGGGTTFSLSTNIGYRFTIVDQNRQTVSKVNGTPGSVDIIWSDSIPDGIRFMTSKFQNISDNDSVGWKNLTITEAMQYIAKVSGNSSVPTMPAWVNTSKTIQGVDFREWMLSGTGVITDETTSRGSGSGSNGSSSSSSGSSGSSGSSSGSSGSSGSSRT